MKWRKLGRVYVPSGEQWWARQYAHLPTVDVMADRLRVYFAGLDESKFGRIGYVDVDRDDPTQVIAVGDEPLLDLGPVGTFDDSGVNPACVVHWHGHKYLYYIGWQRVARTPYALNAGLARFTAEGPQRVQSVPILPRTNDEPYFRSATTVISDGDILKCWYVSCIGWDERDGNLIPTYNLRHATSRDGLNWTPHPQISVELQDDEYGLGRPWVIKDGNAYHLWYSIRSLSQPYRMGYAHSTDGVNWQRLDDTVGIHTSETGWDSEMICYPCVVDVDDRRYMFYNGNSHGASGFGCALLETN
jgi:predicted GH43/DUF377 family glycosyl hydrolase